MSGHTPGPWHAAAGPSSIVGLPVGGPGGRAICNIHMVLGKPLTEAEKAFNEASLANARLIASAPDLFEENKRLREALVEVEAWWLSEGMKHFTGAPYAIFATRAALRKKEGPT